MPRNARAFSLALLFLGLALLGSAHFLTFGRVLVDRATDLTNRDSSMGAATFLPSGTIVRIEATGQEPVRLRISTLHYPSETVTHLVQENATRISLRFRIPIDDLWDFGIENTVDEPNEAWLFVQIEDALPNAALAVAGIAVGATGVLVGARGWSLGRDSGRS